MGRVAGGDVGRALGKKHDSSVRPGSLSLGTWLKMYKKLRTLQVGEKNRGPF